MSDFAIKERDLAPSYKPMLTDARPETPWTLLGAIVRFSMLSLTTGELVINRRQIGIVDNDTHQVVVDWVAGDTDDPGLYLGEFEVTFPGGRVGTFPDGGHVLIEITAAIDHLSVPVNLCTPGDVAGLLVGGVTATEATFLATVLLPALELDAETYMGRALLAIERTETGLALGPGRDFLSLRWTPVRAISEVKVDGEVWTAGSYQVERSGVRLGYNPMLGFPLTASYPASAVDITYVGGLGGGAAQQAKLPIMTRAARIVSKLRDDELGLESLSVEGQTTSYLSEGWTTDERKELDRAGRRWHVSTLQASRLLPSRPYEDYAFGRLS